MPYLMVKMQEDASQRQESLRRSTEEQIQQSRHGGTLGYAGIFRTHPFPVPPPKPILKRIPEYEDLPGSRLQYPKIWPRATRRPKIT